MKLKTKKKIQKFFKVFAALAGLAAVAFLFYHLGSLQSCERTVPDTAVAKVKLFYFNKLKGSLTAVERTLPDAKSPLKETLNLLIKGNLTLQEKTKGFVTDFPNPDFKLLGASIKNGTATLKFNEVPGFTSGGAERMAMLAEQIRKTALQFPQVKAVIFDPEYLFQP